MPTLLSRLHRFSTTYRSGSRKPFPEARKDHLQLMLPSPRPLSCSFSRPSQVSGRVAREDVGVPDLRRPAPLGAGTSPQSATALDTVTAQGRQVLVSEWADFHGEACISSGSRLDRADLATLTGRVPGLGWRLQLNVVCIDASP